MNLFKYTLFALLGAFQLSMASFDYAINDSDHSLNGLQMERMFLI